MARPSKSATVYGDKADLFREIQDEIEEEKGFEPSNAEVVAELMGFWNQKRR